MKSAISILSYASVKGELRMIPRKRGHIISENTLLIKKDKCSYWRGNKKGSKEEKRKTEIKTEYWDRSLPLYPRCPANISLQMKHVCCKLQWACMAPMAARCNFQTAARCVSLPSVKNRLPWLWAHLCSSCRFSGSGQWLWVAAAAPLWKQRSSSLLWHGAASGKQWSRAGQVQTGKQNHKQEKAREGGKPSYPSRQVSPRSLQETQRKPGCVAVNCFLAQNAKAASIAWFPKHFFPGIRPTSKWGLACSPIMEAFSALICWSGKASLGTGLQARVQPLEWFFTSYITYVES